MGHVVLNAMQLIGLSRTPRVDTSLRHSLDHLAELSTKSRHLTDRELMHVKAVQQFADGYCLLPLELYSQFHYVVSQ